ncbi:hypothetical protein [Paenibacillus sp. Marseille-Q4541]|uniref:hypothetical protein n=1 Tax=Paenibacillus sp. Marseille-Q4541 TaxID=2831522 RepID=UPI001BA9CC8B|nr:hypothetical protein [Paenibacillus sp. Marseille-Q4541]
MYTGPLTKGKLIELLKDIPDDTSINVLNGDGELSANVEIWFEDLQTRKFVEIIGNEPLWKIREKRR